MPTFATSRKRKQIEEMEISPPKRVTRSRAAAQTQNNVNKPGPAPRKAQTCSHSSTSATASSAAKSSTRVKTTTVVSRTITIPSKTATRRLDGQSVNQPKDTEAAAGITFEQKKPRGRPKKAVQDDTGITSDPTLPKPRGRPPKARTNVKSQGSERKNKSETKEENASGQIEDYEDDEDDELMAPVAKTVKTTRQMGSRTAKSASSAGRTATNTIKVTAPSVRARAPQKASTTSQTARSAASSTSTPATATLSGTKHVMFTNDSQDKENRPVSQGQDGKEDTVTSIATMKSGVRGKPIRKMPNSNAAATATAAAVAARRRASSSSKCSDEERPKTPLSPKKVDQVAKGNAGDASPSFVDDASSSEDELSGATKPARSPVVRPLQKSPVKPTPNASRELPFAGVSVLSPVKLFGTVPAASSSAAENHALATEPGNLLSKTPARPPSQSSKLGMLSGMAKRQQRPGSRDGADEQILAVPMLASPAKRPPPSPSKGDGTTKMPNLLDSSAKKGASSVSHSGDLEHQNFAGKRSLLQSPARRPKVNGCMTSVPQEKKAHFHFGDPAAQHGDQKKAFRFAAATPRRIKIVKPVSRGLLSDIAENSQNTTLARGLDSPSTIESEKDVSMLDVDNDTIIYTPSKKRTTLFDTPLPTRSRSVSPQKEFLRVSGSPATAAVPTSATPSAASKRSVSKTLFREAAVEESEDESTTLDISTFGPGTSDNTTSNIDLSSQEGQSSAAQRKARRSKARDSLSMTPLSNQLSAWLAASPEKRRNRKSITVPENTEITITTHGARESVVDEDMASKSMNGSPTRSVYTNGDDVFEIDEVVQVTELLAEASDNTINMTDQIIAIGDPNAVDFPQKISEEAIEAGDQQNFDKGIPIIGIDSGDSHGDLEHSSESSSSSMTEGMERPSSIIATPPKPIRQLPREVQTVTRVPLKPADSSWKARSLSGLHSGSGLESCRPVLGDLDLSSLPQVALQNTVEPITPTKGDGLEMDENALCDLATPLRTPRIGIDAQILCGAVVFVDVHTTEGADASGLFVELLNQMGARCVKQWSWNPRSSGLGAETPGGSKVGITHVVFKDGGKRTLEKVRESQGLVSCVGVGWVLDCERHNDWMDEAAYAIDTSVIPRGGHNRRKSMEPRALANINGSVRMAGQMSNNRTPQRSVSSPTISFTPSAAVSSTEGSPEPLDENMATPTIGGFNFTALTPTRSFCEIGALDAALLETPTTAKYDTFETPTASMVYGGDIMEPETPCAADRPSARIQATCPPKQQTGRLMFTLNDRLGGEETNDSIRRRLDMARRKSLQWAPKIGSPLRKV